MSTRRTLQLVIVAAIALVGTAGAGAQNLMKNPSFEDLRDQPTQYGHVFADHAGWVFDEPGKMAIGMVAHSGKYSYEIINGIGGKTRYQSIPMNLAPGRYRMTAYIRGMDIVGRWSSAVDMVCFDDNYMGLKVPGSFGWTPVTHVFDVSKPIENGILAIGLVGSGYLWIDDLDLEKVDNTAELTKTPVMGKDEAPIAPPSKVSADAIHCPVCGYLNNPDWKTCYACGAALSATKVVAGPPVKTLFDFEDGKPGPFANGKITSENVPQGKYALLLDGAPAVCDQVQDWSGYDVLKIDAFNPQDAPVMLSMELYDAQTRGYWTRVNYTTVLPPGNSTVALSTDIFVGEKGRPGRPLFKSKITRMILAPAKYPVTFDNIRLERLDTASVLFNGLEAFHFGLPTSPHMPGYQSVTADTSYAAGRGYGWKGGSRRAFDGLQPDSLFQAFVATSDGSFQVDLPSGKYHVIMNIDSPGGFWGEVQQYTHRTVSVNGKAAVDEKMTMADFQKSYFRNAHKEDPPGLDTFEQYVQAMFNVKQFDIDVTDGKALFDFKADGRWGITLSAMVIYPQAKASEGQKFWDWTTSQRRTQFNNYFKQVVPKGTGDKPPAQGYAVFSRGYSQLPNGNDGPRPQDAIGNEGLSCSIAKGDEEPIVFAVQPGESLGQVALQMSDFVGPGGAKLDPKTFQPGWIDYRITRVTMDGAVYSVAPRYWHPLPAPAANATRNFWIRTKLVGQAAPGKYVGKITIKPKTGPVKDLPLTITVLPFTLEPVKDVAVGPFGCSIGLPWGSEDPQTVQWNERMFGKVLDALHDDGFSTLTGLPHISFQAAGGKVVPNFTQADKEMKALRDRGFDQMICSYGANLSKDDGSPLYQMYGTESGPDEAAAKAAGFADMESFLKAIYAPIEEHAKANNWLPIAWNLSDEPIGDAARASGRNAAVHDKVAKELGLKYQTFTGATSMAGDDPKDEHYGLVTGLSMPMLNDHDDASLKLILSKGHKVALYNLDTRWCYGRYMKAMVVKYGLMYRVNWHLNVVAGDPYYALDCREDDYCWYNTDENQALVPSLALLASTMPGVNDYRYLSTLERLLKEKADAPAAAQAKKVFEEQVNLVAGKDRSEPKDPAQYQADRNKVIAAILALLEK